MKTNFNLTLICCLLPQLLCDSCNADLLEYESMEKRFSQLRERILCSYKGNVTIQNLNNITQAFAAEGSIEATEDEVLKYDDLVAEDNATEYIGVAECDLVEEVQEGEGGDVQEEEEELDIMGSTEENVKSSNNDFDFSAFDEHVAQHSLPPGVLTLSDGLVNLTDVQSIPLDGQGDIL